MQETNSPLRRCANLTPSKNMSFFPFHCLLFASSVSDLKILRLGDMARRCHHCLCHLKVRHSPVADHMLLQFFICAGSNSRRDFHIICKCIWPTYGEKMYYSIVWKMGTGTES